MVQQAEAAGDPAEIPLLAGMGAGRIRDVKPAGQVVLDMIAEATQILHDWGNRVGQSTPHHA